VASVVDASVVVVVIPFDDVEVIDVAVLL